MKNKDIIEHNEICPHLSCLVDHRGGECNCDMKRHCPHCKNENEDGPFGKSGDWKADIEAANKAAKELDRLKKEDIMEEFDRHWYNNFNHINDATKLEIGRICSYDCEKDYHLEDVREWTKQFILKALAEQKKELEVPMGVSQWMNYGAKYKYDEYFREQLLKQVEEIVGVGIKSCDDELRSIDNSNFNDVSGISEVKGCKIIMEDFIKELKKLK